MKTIYLTESDLKDLEHYGSASCFSAPIKGALGSVAYMRVEDAAQMVREAVSDHRDRLQFSRCLGPDDRGAIAMLTDKQAEQSLQRWKERR